MIGPVEVVDHDQERSAGREVSEGRVDDVEQAVPRADIAGITGLQRVGSAGLSQRFGERLERRQRLL